MSLGREQYKKSIDVGTLARYPYHWEGGLSGMIADFALPSIDIEKIERALCQYILETKFICDKIMYDIHPLVDAWYDNNINTLTNMLTRIGSVEPIERYFELRQLLENDQQFVQDLLTLINACKNIIQKVPNYNSHIVFSNSSIDIDFEFLKKLDEIILGNEGNPQLVEVNPLSNNEEKMVNACIAYCLNTKYICETMKNRVRPLVRKWYEINQTYIDYILTTDPPLEPTIAERLRGMLWLCKRHLIGFGEVNINDFIPILREFY